MANKKNYRNIDKNSFVGKELLRTIRKRKKILNQRIYNCCGTKKNLCMRCFDMYHIIQDLENDIDEINSDAEVSGGDE